MTISKEDLISAGSKEAFNLAVKRHSGQVDKAGQPYINHLIAVAEGVQTEEEKTVAYLHDILEDTLTTRDELIAHGFSQRVVDAVELLTQREDRETYLSKIRDNPLAKAVKLSDLTHNSTLARIAQPTERDYERSARYKKEIAFLSEK